MTDIVQRDECTRHPERSENKPCRMWIEEKEEGDFFSTESGFNKKETRIIEYTDTYKNLLKESWKPNPHSSEEIDLSNHIDILVPPSC
ncbi:MAG: hypothetical protein P4L79_13470 [Legionella sp.]|uniref:hypothetical protein n=1 Tax=Legionella sp. TaxID=459 RepID=UPI00285205B4|nr:hypothetical protein [Legionella sp.]